jgi:mannose-6-phosphate isomerase-like protein (cupin superfamily)
MSQPHSLFTRPAHLGRGGAAHVLPEFTGLDWYEDYVANHADDGPEGRLVSLYTFTEDWTSWEMHPLGAEIVACITGGMTLHQQQPDGGIETVRLGPGDYVINPPGVWHTADVAESATAVFVTAGWGTEHRPR